MTMMASGGGGGGGWTAPPSAWQWRAANDPIDGANAYQLKKSMDQLLAASRGAFDDVERQLLSTAQLAEVTARGLNAAKGASWQGNAGDQYRATLSKLPADLNLVNEYFQKAHTQVSAFADTTFELKANFSAFLDDLSRAKGQWHTALAQTYPSKTIGRAAITKIENEITQMCDDGRSILGFSWQASEDFVNTMGGLASASPHEGILTMALGALKDMWKDMTGTWSAILNFINDPTWKNLGQMSTDLGIDAAVVALAAGFPLGLAGVGAIDVDGSVLAVAEAIGDGADAVGLGSGIDGTGSDIAEGNWAAAAFEAWGVSKGIGGSEVDDAVDDVSVLNSLSKDLAEGGHLPDDLSSGELAALKRLVPDYTDPAKVSAAAADADRTLAEATLVKDPAEFIREHFIEDPLEKALAGAIDGNGSGNGG